MDFGDGTKASHSPFASGAGGAAGSGAGWGCGVVWATDSMAR
jgi:hypothetical protein